MKNLFVYLYIYSSNITISQAFLFTTTFTRLTHCNISPATLTESLAANVRNSKPKDHLTVLHIAGCFIAKASQLNQQAHLIGEQPQQSTKYLLHVSAHGPLSRSTNYKKLTKIHCHISKHQLWFNKYKI
jgi:hypothetical protein